MWLTSAPRRSRGQLGSTRACASTGCKCTSSPLSTCIGLDHHSPTDDDQVQLDLESRAKAHVGRHVLEVVLGTIAMLAFGYAGDTGVLEAGIGLILDWAAGSASARGSSRAKPEMWLACAPRLSGMSTGMWIGPSRPNEDDQIQVNLEGCAKDHVGMHFLEDVAQNYRLLTFGFAGETGVLEAWIGVICGMDG